MCILITSDAVLLQECVSPVDSPVDMTTIAIINQQIPQTGLCTTFIDSEIGELSAL